MALLDSIIKKGKVTDDMESAIKLRDFVKGLDPKLRLQNESVINGDKIYAGYRTLRDFYKGRQWAYQKEEGETMRTYNYVFTIVENMTAFLTNEPPQMTCPPRDVTDPTERKMAEGRGKILEAVHEENQLGLVFQRAARTGSIYGDSYIFGAYPEFETVFDENDVPTEEKKLRAIRYWNIDRPWTIRPIWKDDNFTRLYGFQKRYRLFVGQVNELFGEEIKLAEYTIPKDGESDTEKFSLYDDDNLPKVTVKETWTEKEWLVTIGNGDKIIKFMRHNWGFVPLHFVPNIHLPGEPRGTSDIENELDPQQEYNERTSDFGDLIKELAKPTYWGKNLGSVSEVRSGQTVIYEFGEDAELSAMPKSGEPGALASYTADRKNDIINLSGMNQVLYPGNQVLQATGRALSVVMQGVNNKISLRRGWWEATFKELNKEILFLAEKYIPDAGKVIDGYYKSDVFISSVLLRSVTDEINKFNSRVQSLTTTQKNIGVANPSEEQKLMKEELDDEVLMTEIAKQPGMLMQLIQQRAAAAQGAQPQDPNAPPTGAPQGGAMPPVASESDNSGGGSPTPTAGVASPVSPAGAARMMAARHGARTQVPAKK